LRSLLFAQWRGDVSARLSSRAELLDVDVTGGRRSRLGRQSRCGIALLVIAGTNYAISAAL